MKKSIIFLFIIVLASYAFAGPQQWHMRIIKSRGAAAPAYTCVGWANTACTPDSDPSSSDGQDDGILARKWTATENGTAVSVKFYANSPWVPDYQWVVLYRDISGTITLVGKGSSAGASASSWNEYNLVAEGGQTLAFSTSDDLYIGVAFDKTNAEVQRIGRNDSGGGGEYYWEGDASGGPPATTTLSLSANRDMGFILKYE